MRDYKEAVAVFDLDRTITRFGTFSPFLIFSAANRPWRYLLVPLIITLMLIHKAGWIDRVRVKEFMLIMVAHRRRKNMAERSRKFAARLIKRSLRRNAVAAIEEHRVKGHFMILVTASMDFYADEIGRQLGFDAIVATPSRWDEEGCLITKLGGENCFGDAKLHYLANRVAELDGKLAGFERYVYTDHCSDAPLLEWATQPRVVNPNKKAQAFAEEKGYPILDWD